MKEKKGRQTKNELNWGFPPVKPDGSPLKKTLMEAKAERREEKMIDIKFTTTQLCHFCMLLSFNIYSRKYCVTAYFKINLTSKA